MHRSFNPIQVDLALVEHEGRQVLSLVNGSKLMVLSVQVAVNRPNQDDFKSGLFNLEPGASRIIATNLDGMNLKEPLSYTVFGLADKVGCFQHEVGYGMWARSLAAGQAMGDFMLAAVQACTTPLTLFWAPRRLENQAAAKVNENKPVGPA